MITANNQRILYINTASKLFDLRFKNPTRTTGQRINDGSKILRKAYTFT